MRKHIRFVRAREPYNRGVGCAKVGLRSFLRGRVGVDVRIYLPPIEIILINRC